MEEKHYFKGTGAFNNTVSGISVQRNYEQVGIAHYLVCNICSIAYSYFL